MQKKKSREIKNKTRTDSPKKMYSRIDLKKNANCVQPKKMKKR